MKKKTLMKTLSFSCCFGAALWGSALYAGTAKGRGTWAVRAVQSQLETGEVLPDGHGLSVSGLEKSPAVRGLVAAPEDYANVAVSQVTDYVNIRQAPNTSSAVVGKIYNNCAATILQTVAGEGGTWYQIRSGSVSGYIKAQYFITGAQAEAIAKEIGIEYATISASSLRLRAEPNLNSEVLTMLTQGAEYVVLEETGNFAKIAVDEDLTGYASLDYIKTRIQFREAVSLAEEAAKNAEEAQRKQEAAAALQKLEEVKMVEAKADSGEASPEQTTAPGSSTAQPANSGKASSSGGSGQLIAANPLGSGDSPSTAAPGTGSTSSSAQGPGGGSASGSDGPAAANTGNISYGPGGTASTAVVSATRDAVVAYAKQFLGGPYVYGGTSLTTGADCSGFVMQIFAHFGISTGRSSRDQAAGGRAIAINAVQPGDLLFYASGETINHVAIYIGGGQVIHAASSKTGIIISPSNYRTPCKAVSFLD